jgi:hypothetical protein
LGFSARGRGAACWSNEVGSAPNHFHYSAIPIPLLPSDRSLIICRIRAKNCGVGREIQLSGGEITILKAIGLTGTAMGGKFLLDRIEEVEAGEFLDTLEGLVAMGYLLATKVNIRTLEDVERASFRVNPSYAHDLKDALDPYRRREQEKHRRRRRG